MIKFVSDLRQVGGFLWVLRFPPPIKLTAMKYNTYIVESGVKHHNPNSTYSLESVLTLKDFRIYSQLTKLLLKHSLVFICFLLIVQGKCFKKDTMDRSQLKYYSISNFKIKY